MACLTRTLVPALALAAFLSCIERSNPFDPINDEPGRQETLTPGRRDSIRSELGPVLERYADSARSAAAPLDSMRARLGLDSARIDARADSNAAVRVINDSAGAANERTAAHNDTVSSMDSLKLKGYLDTLGFLPVPDTFPRIDQLRYEISVLRSAAAGLIDSVSVLYAPDTLYGPAERDSLLQPFDSLDGLIGVIRTTALALFSAARDTNELAIAPYNDSATAYNTAVRAYNDSVLFAMRYHPYPPIADNDSIQTRLFAAEPGDTLVIAGGVYSPIVRFVNSGTAGSPIVVQGQLDMSTVFDDPDVRLSGNGHIIFQHITFRGNPASGGAKLEAGSGPVTFRSCRFEDNSTFGIEIVDSDARLVDCRIVNNGGSGMRISSSHSAHSRVSLDNVLIAHNRLYGIDIVSTALSVRHTTISDNGRDGIRLPNPESATEVYHSLITYNNRYGVNFESGFTAQYPFHLSYSVLYGNVAAPPITGTFPDTLAYWTFPVSYTDRDANDYSVAPGNRVYELETQGIVVGYREE